MSTANALANLATITAAGSLTIQNGRVLSLAGALSNGGNLTVGANSALVRNGNLTQTAGATTLNGGLLAETAPPPGGALAFNGSTQYVSAPSSAALNPTSQVTVEAWARLTATSQTYGIAGTWDQVNPNSRTYLLLVSGNTARFEISHTGADTVVAAGTMAIQPNRWYHLVGTYDGTTVRVYVNGILDSSSGSGGVLATNTHPLFIGRGDLGAGSQYFNGSLAEVRVWNTALSAAQIEASMSTRLAGNESGLVAYYPLNDGSGTTAADRTANQNNGTLINTPTWVTVAATTVNIQAGALNGTGTVAGNVSNAGQVSPGGSGAAGLLTVTGSYTQTAAGALNVELGGLTAGSQFDQLAVGGATTLNGALNVSLINGFLPAIPNSFIILPFNSVSGDFAAKTGLDAGNGIRFKTLYNPSNLTLGTTAITTTVLSASTATPVYGQTITFTATVSTVAPGAAVPSGSVTFTVDGTPQTPVALSGGQAALSLVLPAGGHTVSAAYNAVSYFVASGASVTPSVAPAPLTITADSKNKVYGDALPPFTASYSGLVNGDTPASLSGTLTFTTTATASSPVGTYAITPGGITSPNYTITFVDGTLTIAVSPLTITADPVSKVYGQANPAFTVSYNGFVNGDTPASLGGTLSFTTAATAASPVGAYSVIPGGLTSGNYTITFVAGTLTVTPAALTVTANDVSKTYGQANPAFSASYSGFVNGDTAASLGGTLTFNTAATASSPVGTYAITPSGLTSTNYSITFANGTLSITPAALTITAVNTSSVYGTAPVLSVRYAGFVNGDTAASLTTPATATSPATAASSVGTYPITAGGATSPNYTITFVGGTLTVMPAALTVRANNATKVYGQANPTFSASYSGFVNGDTAASLGGTLSLTTTATTGSPAGAYAIVPSGLTAGNYTITFANGTLTITRAALTITADPASKVYGQANPAFTASYSGLVNGDTPASLLGTLRFSTPATAASPVGSYTVTPFGQSSGNYTITYVAGTLSVTPAALTVTANDASKVYGQANPAFTASYSGLVNGDTPASLGGTLGFTTAGTASSPVGTYAITPSGLTSANYTITFADGTLTIAPQALTVTANDAAKVYGQANPAFSVSYNGFVNGDTAASLGGTLSFTTAATAASSVGTYAVTPGGLTSLNYAITFVAGTLTVTPAALTVTANDAAKTYGQANPAFSVSYTGFVNGDTAASLGGTLGFSTPATAASPVGTYAVTPGGLTAMNYAITFAAGTLTVTPAALTVTAADAGKVYGQANPTFTASYTGFVNGDTAASLGGTLSISTPATAASPVGTYAITPGGLTATNYAITFANGTLTITPAPLTITANDAGKVYGQANPAFTVSYGGFVNGDTAASLGGALSFTTAATTASGVGGYAVTPGGLTATNYAITFASGTLTVTPAPLTVTANDASRVYGQANPTFSVNYSGFVNGDTPASLGGSLSFTTAATASSPIGTYAVTPGGLTSANYSITFANGTLTITAAALTVTANDASKVYGQANPAFTVSYGGFINGDTPASLGGSLSFTTAATAASGVGGYAVTPGGLTSANYTITFVNGTLTITPAALTISADNQSKLYGAPLPALTVTYSGFVNGDTAASLSTPPAVSTTATAASHVGTYAITAAGAAAANYAITYVAGTLTVTPTVLSVTADNQTKAYGAPLPTLTVTYVGFANGDTAASLTTAPTVTTTATAASHVAGNPYGITASGAVDPDYTFIYAPGTLTVTPAPLTVTADNQTKVYGAALPALTASYGGFVNGDTAASLTTAPTLSTTATASSHVGTYAITAAGAADADYAISYAAGTLTVTPAPLTITADNQTKVYGQANPALTASYGGFVNGDTAASLTTPPALSTTATAASPVGTYPITAAGAADADYAISYVAGTLTITPAATATAVSSSLNPSTVGQSVTFTATVTAVAPGAGTPTGSVTFMDGSTSLGTATLSGGTATLSTATLGAGTHTITVVYAGDGNFTGSTSAALSQAVNNTTGVPVVTAVSPASGTTAGGTVVTITGSGFTGATAVNFGAAVVTAFTVVSDTQITATTPAHADGLVDIQVVTPNGTSVITAADRFTFVEPTVTAVSPSAGSTAGGTVVTITGANFTGVTGVKFGATPAASFTVVSATQITATAPAHAAGVVDIQVLNAGDGSDLTAADRFTYLAPVVTAVSPSSGSTAGGTVLTITGSNFVGVTVVHIDGVTATSFTVVSPTQITATAPAHTPGTVSITVSNAGATSAAVAAARFTYQGPVVSGVSPASGSTAGGTVVTITGGNFVGVTDVRFGGVSAVRFTVVSATQITATAPVHAGGNMDVRVLNAGAASAVSTADQFTYQEPVVWGVTPSSGLTAGGTVVTVFGIGFVGVTQVRFGDTPAAGFTVVSPTQITATAPAHAAGAVDVRVVNAGDTSDALGGDRFTYFAPAVAGVSPNVGSTAGGTAVTITGSHFTGVTQVKFGGTAAARFTVVSDTQITATTPVRAAGQVDVQVVNGGVTSAATAADKFTYQAPAVLGISPSTGPVGGGTVVTITGSGFVGVTAVKFGTTAATSFTVVSSTRITAVAPAHAAGLVDVRVVNAGATSAVATADQFTYFQGTGPAAGGGRQAPAAADPATDQAETGPAQSPSTGTAVTGLVSSLDVQAAALTRAGVENFFRAASGPISPEVEAWVAELALAHEKTAHDALFTLE